AMPGGGVLQESLAMIRGHDQDRRAAAMEGVDLADQASDQLIGRRHHLRVVRGDRVEALVLEEVEAYGRILEWTAVVRIVGVHEEESPIPPEAPQPVARPAKDLRAIEARWRARRGAGSLRSSVFLIALEADVEAPEASHVAASREGCRQVSGRPER